MDPYQEHTLFAPPLSSILVYCLPDVRARAPQSRLLRWRQSVLSNARRLLQLKDLKPLTWLWFLKAIGRHRVWSLKPVSGSESLIARQYKQPSFPPCPALGVQPKLPKAAMCTSRGLTRLAKMATSNPDQLQVTRLQEGSERPSTGAPPVISGFRLRRGRQIAEGECQVSLDLLVQPLA